MRRVVFTFLAALVLASLLALTLGDRVGATSLLDLAAFVAVPAAAFGAAIFLLAPAASAWWSRRRAATLWSILLPASVAGLGVSPVRAGTADEIAATLLSGLLFYDLMLPAVPAIERAAVDGRRVSYFGGLGIGALAAAPALGLLHVLVSGKTAAFVFTLLVMLGAGSSGIWIVRKAVSSRRTGFLKRPMNLAICTFLLILPVAVALIAGLFPEVSVWDDLSFPPDWLGAVLAGLALGGAWTALVFEYAESSRFARKLGDTPVFQSARRELPGFFTAGIFFVTYLILALALNHPALGINTVLFESDAGQWLDILGSPEGEAINRSVHPLVLITARPLIRLVALFMGDGWRLAALLVVAAMSAASVFMAWLFVVRAVGARTSALMFASLFGGSAAQLLFGSLVETFAFSVATLMLFWLLILAHERRFEILVPAGVLTFGMTLSNLAQPLIGLLATGFGFRRLARLAFVILALAVVLTSLIGLVYPGRQTLFFVPSDLAFETRFTQPAISTSVRAVPARAVYLLRTMLLYGIVGPTPVEVVAHKDPRPTLDLKTLDLRSGVSASYDGASNATLAGWLALLAAAVVMGARKLKKLQGTGLLIGLGGSLLFNFLFHMWYGTEMFLYSPYWTCTLILLIALALSDIAEKRWFEYALASLLVLVLVNNVGFIAIVFRAVAPFFAAPS